MSAFFFKLNLCTLSAVAAWKWLNTSCCDQVSMQSELLKHQLCTFKKISFMIFSIKNSSDSLLTVFNVIKKTCISFFFKPYMCSLMSVYLNYSITADLWLSKLWTVLTFALTFFSVTAAFLLRCWKKFVFSDFKSLMLTFAASVILLMTKYWIKCGSAKKICRLHIC